VQREKNLSKVTSGRVNEKMLRYLRIIFVVEGVLFLVIYTVKPLYLEHVDNWFLKIYLLK
jgi:hypothetical protein